ncbi:MAG: NAD(P)H-dependent oxidoreductase [Anaerolineae bacterium]|nr:NAD(P)H-dependent oxidoreductase [Anaerolineae bacterium]
MNNIDAPLHIVGIGGTLRPGSTSLTALNTALSAAAAAGADTTLLDLRTLNLPMYDPGLDYRKKRHKTPTFRYGDIRRIGMRKRLKPLL